MAYQPETIENSSIWMQANHAVLDSDPVNKRFLVVYKVSIRNPELISHTVIQGQIQGNPSVGQTLITPRLLKIHGDGVVLKTDTCTSTTLKIEVNNLLSYVINSSMAVVANGLHLRVHERSHHNIFGANHSSGMATRPSLA